MYPLALLGPGDVSRRDLRQRYERSTGVAEVGQTDGVPGRLRGRRSSGQFDGDIGRGCGYHRFDHVAGLRRAGRDRCDFDLRNRDAHSHRVDARIPGVALVLVDQHEAAWIAKSRHGGDGIDALERRDHCAVGKRKLVLLLELTGVVHFVDGHLPLLNRHDPGVRDPLDVTFTQLMLHQALAVAHATQTHVPDIGFARHIGHGDLVAYLSLAQVGLDDHCSLIGRPEAAGAGGGADDHRAGVLDEFLVARPCARRVILAANRLRVSVGSETRYLLEGQPRAGRDHQVVVCEFVAIVETDGLVLGIDGGHRVDKPLNALAFQWLLHFDPRLRGRAPANRDPGVGWREFEIRPLAY